MPLVVEVAMNSGKPPSKILSSWSRSDLEWLLAYRHEHPADSAKDDVRLALLRHDIRLFSGLAKEKPDVEKLIPKWITRKRKLTPKESGEVLLAWIKGQKAKSKRT